MPNRETGEALIVFNPDGTEQPPYRIVERPGREEPTSGTVLFWVLLLRLCWRERRQRPR